MRWPIYKSPSNMDEKTEIRVIYMNLSPFFCVQNLGGLKILKLGNCLSNMTPAMYS